MKKISHLCGKGVSIVLIIFVFVYLFSFYEFILFKLNGSVASGVGANSVSVSGAWYQAKPSANDEVILYKADFLSFGGFNRVLIMRYVDKNSADAWWVETYNGGCVEVYGKKVWGTLLKRSNCFYKKSNLKPPGRGFVETLFVKEKSVIIMADDYSDLDAISDIK